MENNSVKKFSRAAAILSLTAVLATMPAMAHTEAHADETRASATAIGYNAGVFVELSYADHLESDRITVPEHQLVTRYLSASSGLLSSSASAWCDGEETASDYWSIYEE